ncbi:MAG: prepilin-type N-terminal cleavage/methylation domain-containing protein [Candidatus Omnitrophica bacterium]|nr:prepilin-type N-terminal cleavage/methylation domain-containing protein [Candidatus Omnitrophota bacterium]
MKKNSGLTILEVLIASMIFVIVVSGAVTTLVSIRSLSREFEYRYTALNLARETLEFGEGHLFGHEFRMKYYYPGATVCTLPVSPLPTADNPGPCDPFTGCRAGLNNSVGYGLKESYYFCTNYLQAFTLLGDIKARGLVPKRAPDSVTIYHAAEKDPDFSNHYKETVEVTWQEDVGGETKKETISVIPLRQVNDVLQLNTAEFWWE